MVSKEMVDDMPPVWEFTKGPYTVNSESRGIGNGNGVEDRVSKVKWIWRVCKVGATSFRIRWTALTIMSASPSNLCRPKVGGMVGNGTLSSSFSRLSEVKADLNKRSEEEAEFSEFGQSRGLVIPMKRFWIVVVVVVVVAARLWVDAKNSENLTIGAPPTMDIDLNLYGLTIACIFRQTRDNERPVKPLSEQAK